jgi:hypothetical protein
MYEERLKFFISQVLLFPYRSLPRRCIDIMRPALVFLLLHPGHAIASMEDIEVESVCTEDGCQKHHGEALVQVRRTVVSKQVRDGMALQSNSYQPQVTGATATLDEQGFNALKLLCCTSQMAAFIRRVLEQKGLTICHSGSLNGAALTFDCKDDLSNWAQLQSMTLPTSSWMVGKCPWVSSGTCSPLPNTCPSFPDAEVTPCDTVCCGTHTGYKPSHETVEPDGTIQKFDCQQYKGPIQVYRNTDNAGWTHYIVATQDVVAGTADEMYRIEKSQTGPPAYEFEHINSVAINPVDGLAYGTFKVAGVNYIARFDATSVSFVAKLVWTDFPGAGADWSSLFMGGFGFSGTFYVGGRSTLPSANIADVLAFKNIANAAGFQQPGDPNILRLLPTTAGVSHTQVAGSGADFAIATANYDNTGETEWLFMMDSSGTSLHLMKVPGSDLNNHVLFELTGDQVGQAGSNAFGSAFSFQNQIYVSRNNADGVFYVNNMDLGTKKFTVRKIAGSVESSNNDGMNCLDNLPPFPGECDLPEVEVPKVKGGCPAGTTEVELTDKFA